MAEVFEVREVTEEQEDDIQKPQNIPLRIIDIAKATKIQDGSIRHYRNRFYKYMPVVGEGRKRRYEPYVIQVMLDIKKGFDHGLPAEEIDRVLASKYPICQDGDFNLLDDDEEEENKLMAMPMPDQVNTMATLFSKHIPGMSENLNNLNSTVVNIESNIGDIKALLEQVINENVELKEEINQLKEEKPKGFLNRWFKKDKGKEKDKDRD